MTWEEHRQRLELFLNQGRLPPRWREDMVAALAQVDDLTAQLAAALARAEEAEAGVAACAGMADRIALAVAMRLRDSGCPHGLPLSVLAEPIEGFVKRVTPVRPLCDACVMAAVRESIAVLAPGAGSRLLAELERLRARAAKLAAALEPFAAYAQMLRPEVEGRYGVTAYGVSNEEFAEITAGDLRRARAALEEPDHA